jgi:hypothetical protein
MKWSRQHIVVDGFELYMTQNEAKRKQRSDILFFNPRASTQVWLQTQFEIMKLVMWIQKSKAGSKSAIKCKYQNQNITTS